MNQTEDSQNKLDASVAKTRLWRNLFAAASAAMAAQLVFMLGSPGALVATGIVIVLLLGGLVMTQLRLKRILGGSVDS